MRRKIIFSFCVLIFYSVSGANQVVKTSVSLKDIDASNQTETQLLLVDTILHGSCKDATLALRTITTDVTLGYSCLPMIIEKIDECKCEFDLDVLTEETTQPRWLLFIAKNHYANKTGKNIILTRYADFIRESPSSPERSETQKLAIKLSLNELKHAQKSTNNNDWAKFACNCVMFEGFVTPDPEGINILMNFMQTCFDDNENLDLDTISTLESCWLQLLQCVPERFDEIFRRFYGNFEHHEGDDIESTRTEIFKNISNWGPPILEEKYRGIGFLNGQQLVELISKCDPIMQSNTHSIICRELCGSRTARLKNWEYIWPLIISDKADFNLMSELSVPLPNNALTEEKIHLDAFAEYLYNTMLNGPKVPRNDLSQYPKYLYRTAVKEQLSSDKEDGKNVPEYYNQQKVFTMLLGALDSKNTSVLTTLIWYLGNCSWLNEDAAKIVIQRLNGFKMNIQQWNWREIEKKDLQAEERITHKLDVATCNAQRALAFFSSEREKKEQ